MIARPMPSASDPQTRAAFSDWPSTAAPPSVIRNGAMPLATG